jgi:hypothetical protein
VPIDTQIARYGVKPSREPPLGVVRVQEPKSSEKRILCYVFCSVGIAEEVERVAVNGALELFDENPESVSVSAQGFRSQFRVFVEESFSGHASPFCPGWAQLHHDCAKSRNATAQVTARPRPEPSRAPDRGPNSALRPDLTRAGSSAAEREGYHEASTVPRPFL